MRERDYPAIDRLIAMVDQGLRTVLAPAPPSNRPDPSVGVEEALLSPDQRRRSGGLMRVNHTGEICAQALYSGQAATTRDAGVRAQLNQAAREETEHLAWCERRLRALDTRPSHLNPLWYAGSFLIGAAAGLAGDRWSLGLVVETERQVEAHLEGHLDRLPEEDLRSRAVITQMKEDEARHGRNAKEAGAEDLPEPVRDAMGLCADLMRFVAYRM